MPSDWTGRGFNTPACRFSNDFSRRSFQSQTAASARRRSVSSALPIIGRTMSPADGNSFISPALWPAIIG
jgi:hypothetical protein